MKAKLPVVLPIPNLALVPGLAADARHNSSVPVVS